MVRSINPRTAENSAKSIKIDIDNAEVKIARMVEQKRLAMIHFGTGANVAALGNDADSASPRLNNTPTVLEAPYN